MRNATERSTSTRIGSSAPKKTLTRFTIETEHALAERSPTGDFSGLLNAVATAVKVIANHVNRGALLETSASGGGTNVQGEVQRTLDVLANDTMIAQTEWTGHLAGMVSEEVAGVIPIPNYYRVGKYLLVFDPLDGSSNIDVNITVGSIFSVLRHPRPGQPAEVGDFLVPGREQVCAGFALYGPATMLVLTTGDGVNGFTLDRDVGDFILTHPNMTIPDSTAEFAINSSKERFWEPPVRRYVQECLAGTSGPRRKDFNMRWIASAVADTFRILTRGGVFLYPADTTSSCPQGRLRLLYEANPIAFIVEQAGGLATTGLARVLDVVPSSIHQRVPLIFGSSQEVRRVDEYHLNTPPAKQERSGLALFNTRSLFRD